MSARNELAECDVPLTGAAAVRLYDDHVDAVHALVARRVGIEASPAITAEAFKHALDRWDRFDQQRGTERLFLFGAAVTVLRDHPDLEYRHLSNLRYGKSMSPAIADPLVADHSDSIPRVVDHAANHDLFGSEADERGLDTDEPSETMRAVANLASDDRDILLLSLWESCPQSSIAEMLDIPVSSVRSSLGRVRRELKSATSNSPSTGRRRR